MIKKIGVVFLLFCLSSTTVFSYDLRRLEDAFVKDGEITAYVVVANKGTANDVLSQIEIITYLGKFTDESTVGVEKLVSDIEDIYATDIISIGNPCVNSITKDIMDYDGDCNFNEGIMQFYNKNNKTQLIIFGPSDTSTREAVTSMIDKQVEGDKKVIVLTDEEKVQKEEEFVGKIEQNTEPKIQESQEQQPVLDQPPQEIEQKIGLWDKITRFFQKLFGIK
jgi:hypothetical protein